MQPVIKTTNPVLLSYAVSLLKDAGIPAQVYDRNISFIEGGIGVFPRRLMVADDMLDAARTVLVEAGLKDDLTKDES